MSQAAFAARTLARRLRDRTAGLLPPLRSIQPPDEGPLLDEGFLRQIEHLRLADVEALFEALAGEHAGRARTQAIEFNDYRSYSPGDDFRQIDWNVYGRLGQLFVKTSLAEESISLSLLVDCSRSMDWGRPNKLRHAKRLAAALGAIALLHYDTVRLYCLGDGRAVPGTLLRGRDALPFMVRELDAMPVAATTDLLRCIEDYRRLAERQGTVVLLSDLLIPLEQEDALAYLADNRVRAAALHVIDPAEADPRMRGAVELRDLESRQHMELVVTPAVRRRYIEHFEARVKELESRSRIHQVGYVRALTSVPPADLILRRLQQERLIRAESQG